MSSHHVIRDKQEPGILILSWEERFPELLEHLCQWSPIIVVDDSCLADFLELGLKLNYVIGEKSSWEEKLEYQQPYSLLPSGIDLQEIEKEVMPNFHILGKLPWELSLSDSHVYYSNGFRYSKLKNGDSIWLGPEQEIVVYNERGEKVITLKGSSELVQLGDYQNMWIERIA